MTVMILNLNFLIRVPSMNLNTTSVVQVFRPFRSAQLLFLLWPLPAVKLGGSEDFAGYQIPNSRALGVVSRLLPPSPMRRVPRTLEPCLPLCLPRCLPPGSQQQKGVWFQSLEAGCGTQATCAGFRHGAGKLGTLSHSCLSDVSICFSVVFRFAPDVVVSQLHPRVPPLVLQLSSTCLPCGLPDAFSQMWPPLCFPVVSQTSKRSGPPIVSQLSCSCFQTSSCIPDVASHLSPSSLRLSYRCGLPIVSPMVSQFVPDVVSQLSSTCLPQLPVVSPMRSLVSQMRSPNNLSIAFHMSPSCLPDVVFSLHLNPLLPLSRP